MKALMLSIASGKGGTGKTTVAVYLALSFSKGNAQPIDCDGEEPNSTLFLSPSVHQITPWEFRPQSKCTSCGQCA